MSSLRDDIKLQVQQATDIVRLVGEQVALRPRGREFLGLCPFHDDKNPSMYVSPAKQIYKCFACGAGGDVFSFVMSYHRMTFPEALKHLAERAGIKLPERRPGPGADGQAEAGPTDRQRLLDAHAKAAAFFRALFRHAEHGRLPREYVARRGIAPEMVEAFQIGYAPDRWDGLALMVGQESWSVADFTLAGLITPRQGPARDDPAAGDPGAATPDPARTLNHYDRFRHRLMFPICDAIGRIIAFGGRKMREEDEPKYLNSPESAVFNKSATLYGLHLAKKAVIDSRTAVIVEGYTDVIACHQHGLRNVVATLGTALTSQHVAELRRYCEKVVLVYDADEAGIKAADRALEIFLAEGLDVAIAVLPEQLDPAELLERPDGVERWTQAIEGARDALVFQFERARSQAQDAQTVTGRQRVVEEYLRRLAQLGFHRQGPQGLSLLRRSLVLQRLAALLHLDEQAIAGMLRQMAPARAASRPEPAAGAAAAAAPEKSDVNVAFTGSAGRVKALQLAERQVIGVLIRRPALFHQTYIDGRPLDEALTPSEMLSAPAGEAFAVLYQHLAEGREPTLAELAAQLAEEGRPGLTGLITQAEAEVEAACQDDEERLQETLRGAVQALVQHRQGHEYQTTRRRFNDRGAEPGAARAADGQTEQDLRRIAQYLAANPRPHRVPVVRP